MRFDCVYAFGCSNATGAEHEDWEIKKRSKAADHSSDDVYTHLIADHYQVPHFNWGEEGCANQSIYRQVIEAVDHAKMHQHKPLFWVMWTKFFRQEIYHCMDWSLQDQKKFYKWPMVWPHNEIKKKNNLPGQQYVDKRINYQDWSKNYFKHADDLTLISQSLFAMYSVQNLLIAQQYDHVFTSSFVLDSVSHAVGLNPEFLQRHLVKAFDVINRNIFINSPWWWWSADKRSGFLSWIRENGYTTYPGGHATELSHQRAFEAIIESKFLEKFA